MQKCFIALIIVISVVECSAQGVAINTNGTSAHSSAMLDIKSNDKGLLIPRTSTAGRKGIANPAIGLMVFDTTESTLYMYDGNRWLGFQGMSDRHRPINKMIVPPDQQDTLFAGFSVSVWNDFAVVGTPYRHGPATLSGGAYVYKRTGENWSLFTILSPSSGALDNAAFGYSVNICGNYIIVGAPYKKNGTGTAIGAAYVYTYNGNAWEQSHIFWGTVAGTDYGNQVEINETGTYAAVSEPGATVSGLPSAGTIRVYNKGASWFLQGSLADPLPQASERFGSSMAMSPSGTYIIGGASFKDFPGCDNCGAAIIFARSGILWLHHKTLSNASVNYIQKGAKVDISNTSVMVFDGGINRVTNYYVNGPWDAQSYTYTEDVDGIMIDPVSDEYYVWAPPYVYTSGFYKIKTVSTPQQAMGEQNLFSIYNGRFVAGVPYEPGPAGIFVGGYYFGVVNEY